MLASARDGDVYCFSLQEIVLKKKVALKGPIESRLVKITYLVIWELSQVPLHEYRVLLVERRSLEKRGCIEG
jgi:hypothetical protein